MFCNIAKGFAPANIRYQDYEFLAFDDHFPKATTHILIVPRAHHKNLDDWVSSDASSDRMLEFVARTANEVGINGNYRLITNVGRDAGQLIYHVHWHLLSGDLSTF